MVLKFECCNGQLVTNLAGCQTVECDNAAISVDYAWHDSQRPRLAIAN